MISQALIAMFMALTAQAAVAVEGVAALKGNSGMDVHLSDAPSRQFLPPLEYDLPVGPAHDMFGWIEVQHILQSRGYEEVELSGSPDVATLEALTDYLTPLAEKLVARVETAETIAKRESSLDQPTPGPFRYAHWSRTETEGQYSGEMYFPYAGQPTPAGYVGVSGSGWPHMSEYYRPGDRQDSPLCHLTRFGMQSPGYFSCKLLDGDIEIRQSDEKREIIFSVDEQPIVHFVTWPGDSEAKAAHLWVVDPQRSDL